jgi:hypothetical protein
MAIRRTVFAQGLKFAEWIGPDGSNANYNMGSETEFCNRAYSLGHKTWFAREPMVWHIVRSHQLEPRFWSQRAYRNGRGRARMAWNSGAIVPRFVHSPVMLAAGIAYNTFRQWALWCRTLTPVPQDRLDAIWNYYSARGFRDEYLEQRRHFRDRVRLRPSQATNVRLGAHSTADGCGEA